MPNRLIDPRRGGLAPKRQTRVKRDAAMEGQALLIQRLDRLESQITEAQSYAREAHRLAQSWTGTLKDHSKTVGVMDAWRKELERRIAEISIGPTTQSDRLQAYDNLKAAIGGFISELIKSDPVFVRRILDAQEVRSHP